MADCLPVLVADKKDVFDSLLGFELVQRVVLVTADLADLEPLFCEHFLLVFEVVNYLNCYLVRRLDDVESQDFFPLGHHALRLSHLPRVFNLVVVRLACVSVAHNDLDHGFEGLRVEELVVKLALNDVESERGALHYGHAFNFVARILFLHLRNFSLYFLDLFIHAPDVVCQEFDVVFAVLESFELQIDELLNVDVSVLVHVHLHENLLEQLIGHFLLSVPCLVHHEPLELGLAQVVVVVYIIFIKSFLQVPLEELVVLPPVRLFSRLVERSFSLPDQDLVRVETIWAFLEVIVVNCGGNPSLIGKSRFWKISKFGTYIHPRQGLWTARFREPRQIGELRFLGSHLLRPCGCLSFALSRSI